MSRVTSIGPTLAESPRRRVGAGESRAWKPEPWVEELQLLSLGGGWALHCTCTDLWGKALDCQSSGTSHKQDCPCSPGGLLQSSAGGLADLGNPNQLLAWSPCSQADAHPPGDGRAVLCDNAPRCHTWKPPQLRETGKKAPGRCLWAVSKLRLLQSFKFFPALLRYDCHVTLDICLPCDTEHANAM